jgi:hypothetical protein
VELYFFIIIGYGLMKGSQLHQKQKKWHWLLELRTICPWKNQNVQIQDTDNSNLIVSIVNACLVKSMPKTKFHSMH